MIVSLEIIIFILLYDIFLQVLDLSGDIPDPVHRDGHTLNKISTNMYISPIEVLLVPHGAHGILGTNNHVIYKHPR